MVIRDRRQGLAEVEDIVAFELPQPGARADCVDHSRLDVDEQRNPHLVREVPLDPAGLSITIDELFGLLEVFT